MLSYDLGSTMLASLLCSEAAYFTPCSTTLPTYWEHEELPVHTMLEGGLMEDMDESKPSAYVCAYLSLTNFFESRYETHNTLLDKIFIFQINSFHSSIICQNFILKTKYIINTFSPFLKLKIYTGTFSNTVYFQKSKLDMEKMPHQSFIPSLETKCIAGSRGQSMFRN